MENIFAHQVIPEDTVTYEIYRVPDDKAQGADPLPSPADLLTQVETLLAPYTADYLWQKAPFHLTAHPDGPGRAFRPVLSGRTAFGDCLEDEWFIVFLLRRLSTAYPQLAVTVTDSDGQFLLIEAAEAIPEWLTPQNSAHRVYLYRGDLHIIQSGTSSADHGTEGTDLTLSEGLTVLATEPSATRASDAVQRAVFSRLVDYPRAIRTHNQFRTRCYVPHRVAHLLYHQPQLLAAAVEAFYLRDPVALRLCRDMRQFPPASGVLATVRWTRTMYAQTVGQAFVLPKIFDSDDSDGASRTIPTEREREVGAKLACGFEIVCRGRDLTDPGLPDQLHTEAAERRQATRWEEYRQRLEDKGYFGDERPGSQLYQAKETAARNEFERRMAPPSGTEQRSPDDLDAGDTTICQIHGLLQQPLVPVDTLMADLIPKDDSDAWMYVHPDHLDEVLRKQQENVDRLKESEAFEAVGASQSRTHAVPTGPELSEAFNMADMVDQFQAFLDRDAGLAGAEFESERSDSEGSNADDEETEWGDLPSQPPFGSSVVEGGSPDAPISFDPTLFFATLERALATPATDTSREPTGKRVQFAKAESEPEDPELGLDTVMGAMDSELAGTKVGESFERRPTATADAEEMDAPVDVDLNLVKNILASFKAQQGLP
ncbi:hypothetical protein IWQ60_012368, partial [Tieghemiomyces parasiticus]